jgi:hypothetical protein
MLASVVVHKYGFDDNLPLLEFAELECGFLGVHFRDPLKKRERVTPNVR